MIAYRLTEAYTRNFRGNAFSLVTESCLEYYSEREGLGSRESKVWKEMGFTRLFLLCNNSIHWLLLLNKAVNVTLLTMLSMFTKTCLWGSSITTQLFPGHKEGTAHGRRYYIIGPTGRAGKNNAISLYLIPSQVDKGPQTLISFLILFFLSYFQFCGWDFNALFPPLPKNRAPDLKPPKYCLRVT